MFFKINIEEASVLLDIIKLIDYNIDLIIDKVKTRKNMIKFYKNSIMTILKSIEKNRNFEFLYLCILLIISRMRDDIDKYNENYTRMPSNKSIYNTGNLNSQATSIKISEMTLESKKIKTTNLNTSNSNNPFCDQSNHFTLSPKNTTTKYNKNSSCYNNANINVTETFKNLDVSENINNPTKDQKLDFSFTNQNLSSYVRNKNEINKNPMSVTNINMNSNYNSQNIKNNFLYGYTGINRVSPNINSNINQSNINNNRNSNKQEKQENNYFSQTSLNVNSENEKNMEKYSSIKDYSENNESRRTVNCNSVISNTNNNTNHKEKILLDKNQNNETSENIINMRFSNEERYSKDKENDLTNYFGQKTISNTKNKLFSLNNFRKEKERDIDRESIFSFRNKLKFDFNISTISLSNFI